MWASPEVLTLILDLIGSLRYLREPLKVTPTLNGKHSVACIKPSPNSTGTFTSLTKTSRHE